MSLPPTPATVDVAERGVTHSLSVIGPVSSAAEAAAERNVAVAALGKTLVVRRSDDDYLFVVVGGDRVIDWGKLRAVLGVSRLSMPDAEVALAVTGYVRGTITPFGSKRALPVVVDEALLEHSEVAVGGGGHGIGIHLAPTDLVNGLGASVANVSKLAG